MTRLCARFAVFAVALIIVSGLATAAHAKVGVAFGPHIGKSPLTPHIGRVYWKPGAGNSIAQAIRHPQTELDQFLADWNKTKKVAHRAKCMKLHLQYISRHGFTTPRPLKGFSGCQKYAMDQAYWHPATSGVTNNSAVTEPVATITNNTVIAVHNIVLPW